MKEQKRRHSLSGAVLIMVLTVMVVLLIMLMATLTVVTTANQRIYTKFEENQAYYTARSALDVFTKSMLVDKNYYSDKANADNSSLVKSNFEAYLNGNNDKTHEMTQGLALQLDMYSLYCVGGENVDQDDLKSYAMSSGITGTDDAKDEYINYFGTQIKSNGDPEGSTQLVYEVWLPQVAGTSGDYGKLSDGGFEATPTGVTAGGGKATITVEVVDRRYDLGTYTDGGATKTVEESNRENFFDPANYMTNKDKIAEAIFNGNRKKDVMRVKITATSEFEGTKGTAVIYYDTREKQATNTSKAITLFSGAVGDNFSIVGGGSMVGSVNWSNDGVIWGNFFVEDNFTCAPNGPRIYLTKGESAYVGGDFTDQNDHFGVNSYGLGASPSKDDRPILFIEGTYSARNTKPGNVTGTDLIVRNGINTDTNEFAWDGDIYCVGNFDLRNGTQVSINGDVYVEGDIIVSGGRGGFQVNGSTIDFSGVTGKVYCSGTVRNDPNPSLDTLNFDANLATGGIGEVDPSNPKYDGTTYDGREGPVNGFISKNLPAKSTIIDPNAGTTDIEFRLPDGTVATGVNKKMPTHVRNFNEYYEVDALGNLIIDPTTSRPIPIDSVTESGVPFNDPSFISGAAELPNSNINTAATERYHLSSGSRNITISGGGTVEIVLDGTSYGALNITVDDDPDNDNVTDGTSVVFYMPKDDYWFEKFQIYTSATKRAVGGSPIHVGDHMEDPIHQPILVPPIKYYCQAINEIEVQNDFFMTGYFYGPDTTFNIPVGNGAEMKDNMTYNGNSLDPNQQCRISMIGSVLCADINAPNAHGVAYINPDLDAAGTPGLPIHDWNAYRYARN